MDLDLDLLRNAIQIYAKGRWADREDEWPLRPGGGEVYLQERILAKAGPCLAEQSLAGDVRGNLATALNANMNLLSQFEGSQALLFVKTADEQEVGEHVRDLLYGPDDILRRIKDFLQWSKVRPLPEQNKKMGINATVASYLLAMSAPHRYAFCKPSSFAAAFDALIGKAQRERDQAKRLVQCTDLYKSILSLLENDYGLQDGNLLDVHSLFYLFHADGVWANATGKPVSPKAHPEPWPDDLQQTRQLLIDRHNVVLYGPPGTGKTYQAMKMQQHWRQWQGADAVDMVTFHPSYSYEDFIEGFRPAGGDGTAHRDEAVAGFALKDGVFKECCKRAAGDLKKKFLLVIDEINRGDVARIFGELITLIESDKRARLEVTLPQSQQRFSVPGNLYLLGTMNTADKSISLMDTAIRRRFRFRRYPPDPDVLAEGREHLSEIEGLSLAKILMAVNSRLADRDRAVGHSYLLIAKSCTDPVDELRRRFRHDIIPLLEEYYFSRPESVQEVLGDLVDRDAAPSADCFEDDDPSAFVAALNSLLRAEEDGN